LTGPYTEWSIALADLLKQAGERVLPLFQNSNPRPKQDGSWVTDADLLAEEIILDGLNRLFPEHNLISEESGRIKVTDGAPTWFIDPIDGTGAFLEGLAHWGPTVTLVQENQFCVGALAVPRLSEFWFAARGEGAWRDGRRLVKPADRAAHEQSLYLPSRYHKRMPIPWKGKVRALGSSACHLAQTASGGADATVIPSWEPWDIGCGVLLVEEAGRIVTNLAGEVINPMSIPGAPLLAGAASSVAYLSTRLQTS